MLGIAAITANNGWAMAFTGACIVMTGLAVLSFIISQLHKIIAFMEGIGKKAATPEKKETTAPPKLSDAEIDILNDLPAAARIYSPLTAEVGDSFSLMALYRIFEKENLPHPHITIMALRNAGFIVPAGEGNFSWSNL